MTLAALLNSDKVKGINGYSFVKKKMQQCMVEDWLPWKCSRTDCNTAVLRANNWKGILESTLLMPISDSLHSFLSLISSHSFLSCFIFDILYTTRMQVVDYFAVHGIWSFVDAEAKSQHLIFHLEVRVMTKMRGTLVLTVLNEPSSVCDKDISHTIHVWYFYLHLVDFYRKCR